jgi:hypothetical protein
MDDVKQAFIEAEEEILDPDSLELEQFDERIANAYMKQVLLLQAKIVSIYDISQSEIERIQKIRDELLAKNEERLEKYKNKLELYMWKLRNSSGDKTKSYEGFYGKMGFRKLPDKVVIINEEELIRELEYKLSSEELRVVYPEKTIRTLSKSSLKTLMKETKVIDEPKPKPEPKKNDKIVAKRTYNSKIKN